MHVQEIHSERAPAIVAFLSRRPFGRQWYTTREVARGIGITHQQAYTTLSAMCARAVIERRPQTPPRPSRWRLGQQGARQR